MCGIFAYVSLTSLDIVNSSWNSSNTIENKTKSNKIQHRGPDSTTNLQIDSNVFFSFHRLAINGLDEISNQPMELEGIHLICNGEIFNFKQLIREHNFENVYRSNSDCEIILHLYNKYGIYKTCELLDGEFSFVIYDSTTKEVHIVRDPLGIRSLYWNPNSNEMCISSELKSTIDNTASTQSNIVQFPTGTIQTVQITPFTLKYNKPIRFFYNHLNLEYKSYEEQVFETDESVIISNIRDLFTNAVNKRLLSDRKIACLLSGGLDSTTVCAVVASKFPEYSIDTYSIGLKGSVDLHYAKIAAEYFKTNHTSIEVSITEFLNAIERTIIQIESYDTTSVRASIGNFLISLYINEHSDNKVIFCGDVSDEIFGSYRGFYYAPSDKEFYEENVKLLQNIQYFDVLRSDKSISGAGLEARVPFSDHEFLHYCMKIHPSLKRFGPEKMEKYLFRKAFEDMMPTELVWRVKTAFSDGVSSSENPWFEILKEYIDNIYTDEQYEELRLKYTHNMPDSKESLYYREIYEKHYPDTAHTIPYFWKQPFTSNVDPSAWSLA